MFSPSGEEVDWAREKTSKATTCLMFLVLLKTFQHLHYFPDVATIPMSITFHIRRIAGIKSQILPPTDKNTTLYRAREAVRDYLRLESWGSTALHLVAENIASLALVRDDPADLINNAVDTLVKARFELPAFSTLSRCVRRIRTVVNRRLFRLALSRCSEDLIQKLEALLQKQPAEKYSPFNELKALPQNPTRGHLREAAEHLLRLRSWGDLSPYLEGITGSKIHHFAGEARVLDAGEMKDFDTPKRITLLLCLLYRTQTQALDDLITMFCKKIGGIRNKAKEALALMQSQQGERTERLLSLVDEGLTGMEEEASDAEIGVRFRLRVNAFGGAQNCRDDYDSITKYLGDNFLPLVWSKLRNHMSTLLEAIRRLDFRATVPDTSLADAVAWLLENESRRKEWDRADLNLRFVPDKWMSLIRTKIKPGLCNLRHLKACIIFCLAHDLQSGDLCVPGSEEYSDYRDELISDEECRAALEKYCGELGFAPSAEGFVADLKQWICATAEHEDANYPESEALEIKSDGKFVLKRYKAALPRSETLMMEQAILKNMPERGILEVLSNVERWTNWTRHFGPASGSESKIANSTERYILTAFAYGCNLGPMQAAKHLRKVVTVHDLSFTNRRHVTAEKLEAAIVDILNKYRTLELPKLWGDGSTAAADGTKVDIYDRNLIAAYHFRYRDKGAVAYHHVADNYIAIFSHFIVCGVWEGVYILNALHKNKSDIRPNTLYSDTQGQSVTVFAFAYLSGIELMPRIRNLQDYVFFRPDENVRYRHIDGLFRDKIDWKLIQVHWFDMMKVILSIGAGKISSPTLLRKLGTESKKSSLYLAFRELGRAVRTEYLLRYVSNLELRRQITAGTNKAEAYNKLSDWLLFGNGGVIADNDPIEQEKVIKYNDLVTNALILQNASDLAMVVRKLVREGFPVKREDLALMSPYIMTVRRFGDYVLDRDAPEEELIDTLSV